MCLRHKGTGRACDSSLSVASDTIIVEVLWSPDPVLDPIPSPLYSPRFGLPLNKEDNSNDLDIKIGLDEAFVYTA
jgi:hypothetical protein